MREIMDSIGNRFVERVVIKSSAQIGKALAIDTPIPTPYGWTTMGELRAGDYVFDEEGNKTLVTFATEVMNERECFEFVFSDDSKIVCDAEHIWRVDERIASTIKTQDRTAKYIFEHQKTKGKTTFSIPIAKAIQLPERNLPISPYTLGAWLGDGISVNNSMIFHKDDFEIAEAIAHDGYPIFVCNRDKRNLNVINVTIEPSSIARSSNQKSFKTHLSELGLINNKHIPEKYLRASYEQRFELLQGLMDTDGTINKEGHCELVGVNRALMNSCLELIRSLGIKATVKQGKSAYYKNGNRYNAQDRFRIYLFPNKNQPVFKLKRKLKLMVPPEKQNNRSKIRMIREINLVKSVPVKCIQVASKSKLYLCGKEMIPTHNTELINNCIGYFIHQDPSPMLVLQPTLDMAQAYSKDRLAPMIRDTEVLRDKVNDVKSRDGGNTLLQKKFPGGHISLAGANSPASLASRPMRVVLADEISRYPLSAGTEGDPVKLAQKRATTFFNRKFIEVSTPTISGVCRIEKSYNESDQREFQIACPHCNHFQTLEFSRIKWEGEEQPINVRYECAECQKTFQDNNKHELLIGGKWKAKKPFTGTAGFHINELYSPWRRWEQVVKDFIEAKSDPERLKVWVNTAMGETWKAKEGDSPDWSKLYLQREHYEIGSVPAPVLFLTAGCDVQKDRIECEVIGWGKDKQRWSIIRHQFFGDTSQDTSEPFQKLDEILSEQFFKDDGRALEIKMLAIDSGFNTQAVYNWSRRQSPTRVMVVKGRDNSPAMVNQPTAVDVHAGGKRISRGAKVWTVGSSIIKSELYSWLKLQAPTDGKEYPACFCHFPEYDEDYFKQLTAEQVTSKVVNGNRVFFWEKVRERNETLDLHVYARAAAHVVGLDRFNESQWAHLTPSSVPVPLNTQNVANKVQPTAPTQPQRPQPRRKSNWL